MARILIIEDDRTFLGLLQVHLEAAGHTVETAADAAEGLRAVVERQPDLILLDLFVPFLDGFELLEALRSEPATRALPVIVITGRGSDDAYARATRIGVQGYFTKPVEGDALLAAIEAQLSRAARSGRAPR